ncbi:nudC domain-containing protein 1 [Venturia canescens]|uniref:nudC domain-containing protein 1 n=1 Tax=Venturia canescens TaxID=32260 RepID=UPI001C9D622A|nr:nudC domain-containing protein 1 [Venturia canescens]
MTKIIELRPDISSVDQNFEKYQYSADPVTINLEKTLPKDVYRQEPDNTQDSWLEARIFAFHNHLFRNPFDSSCWYVDENQDVWKLSKDGSVSCHHRLSVRDQKSSTYNPSIVFASQEVIVLSNGGECLEILIENSSAEKETFKTTDITPGVLLDSRYFRDKALVMIAMCCLTEVERKKQSQLIILSYEHSSKDNENNVLKLVRKNILKIRGPIEYAYIEANGDYVHAISQNTAIFEYDSTKPVETKKAEYSENEKELKIPKYCWSQDEDSLTVWIKIAEKNRDDILVIDATATSLSVCLKGVELIKGDLQHRLDPDLTTWNREKDTIKLELVKHESGLMWNELIRGDTGGECLPNEALAAEIHNRLSHLCTSDSETGEGQPLVGFNADQLEECDLQDQDNFLQRINLNEHSTTHLAMLGSSNHVLFTQKLTFGQRLCLRHDHHGCIWIPRDNDTENWDVEHVDTFPGIGYVEASKTNKKFCISPPNGSYVAIVEHTRHAFLYEKPEGSAPIAKQRIVDLGSDSTPIMGAVATNEHLILLTTTKLYRLVIRSR